MSANSSRTNVSLYDDGHLEDLVAKIESRRAAGEFSPASSPISSRPSSVIDHEKGEVPQAPQPITHRPTGFKV
jgi:hypothetical protein